MGLEVKEAMFGHPFTYNSTLKRAIESIGKQTYKNWKLIVNENGSRDRLIFVTNKYIKKISISS